MINLIKVAIKVLKNKHKNKFLKVMKINIIAHKIQIKSLFTILKINQCLALKSMMAMFFHFNENYPMDQ